jgi:hypothetical protein
MNTLATADTDIQIDEKTGQHYTTVAEEGADYITIADYIRRRHAADLEKDPLADPLYDSSLRKVIKRGEIVLFKQGIHFFIDWNKYRNWVFHRYKQGPKKSAEPKQKKESVSVTNQYVCPECSNTFKGTHTASFVPTKGVKLADEKRHFSEGLMKKAKKCPNCRTEVSPKN